VCSRCVKPEKNHWGKREKKVGSLARKAEEGLLNLLD